MFDRKCWCGTVWHSSIGDICPDCGEPAVFLGGVESVTIDTAEELFGLDVGIPVTDDDGTTYNVDFNKTMGIWSKHDTSIYEGLERAKKESTEYVRSCPEWTEEDQEEADRLDAEFWAKMGIKYD